MSKSVLIKIFYTSAVLLMMACREKYILPDSGPARGYLVVEGFINSGNGPTNIRLSRAVGLVDTINHNYEQFASVRVEGSDNSQYTLTEAGPGLYSNTNLNLDASKQYRLHIITADGNEYLSDFEQALNTPEIDTITWERQDGVEIFANTHDPSGNTRYYRWEYEETWQFHSAFFSSIKYLLNGNGNIVGVTDRDYAESLKLYTCWKSQNSKSILIGSSVNFSKDSIHLPLVRIPEADWRLSVLYSTLVKQTAVSSKEYDFLRRMKKKY